MGIIGMSQTAWDDMESKTGGFTLCPAGNGLLLTVTSHREGSYEDKKTGKPIEYVTFACTHIDAAGIKSDHWEFFNLTEKDMPYLKGFLEKLERQDIFRLGEDAEWEVLYGTAFTADIKHRTEKKTNDVKSNLMRNTMLAVSHEDGAEVADWREVMGLEEEEEEEEKPKKKAKKVVKKSKKVEEEEEDDDGEEGEEDDDAPPKRSRRRTRRQERED